VAAILTGAERRLLNAQCASLVERPSWVTRFWAAKEAIAKAMGTGLGGRPHQFAVERIDGERLLVATGENAPCRWVHTIVGTDPNTYAVAWTLPDAMGRHLNTNSTHRSGEPDDA
jgi:phosphopantetheinyl transferase